MKNIQDEKMELMEELSQILLGVASLNSTTGAMSAAVELSKKAENFYFISLKENKPSKLERLNELLHGQKTEKLQ